MRSPPARQTMGLRPVAVESPSETAKCPRCARVLEFPTDTNGVVIETCPGCGPLRAFAGVAAARPVPVDSARQQGSPTPGRVCLGCGHPLRGKQRKWCGTHGQCAAMRSGWQARFRARPCIDCGRSFVPGGAKAQRCVTCKRQHPSERGRAA